MGSGMELGVIYNGKCNYYVFINCIRNFFTGEFTQNYVKITIFNFSLIWGKSLVSHTGWTAAKPLLVCPWTKIEKNEDENFQLFI